MNKKLINLYNIIKLIIIAFMSAILGAYAGAEGTSKNWRRIGLPLILTITAYLTLKNIWTLVLFLLFLPFIMGHGIPCWNDEGSLIGRFWYNLIKKYNPSLPEALVQEYTNYPTRGLKGLIISLILSCIPFIKDNWTIYIICSLGIILTYTFISWKDFGVYYLFGKQLLWVDTYTYFLVSLFILITIFF